MWNFEGKELMDGSEIRETKVGVLDKAMAILLAFPAGNTALSPQEIAARTNMPLPTVYRLAQALCEHGMLMRDGQQFRLGMTLLRLGTMVAEGIDVRRQVQGYLRWLNEQTEENAELHIRQDETRIVIEVVSSPHNLRPFADIGAPLPLHRGAAGKVLLAWIPVVERDMLIDASVARFNDQQFDKGAFVQELVQVRVQGWAYSDGERASGVSALAAPIFEVGNRQVGALTLVVPAARLGEEQRIRYIPLVQEAARRASYDLGYAK
jgi:IclR family acetate operon transcriptional repressor